MSDTVKQVLFALTAVVVFFALAFAGIIVYKVFKQKKDNVNIEYSITSVEFDPKPVRTYTSTNTIITGDLPVNNSHTSFVYEGTVSGKIHVDYEGKWAITTDIVIDEITVAQFSVYGEGKEETDFSVEYSGMDSHLCTSDEIKLGKSQIFKTDQILFN